MEEKPSPPYLGPILQNPSPIFTQRGCFSTSELCFIFRSRLCSNSSKESAKITCGDDAKVGQNKPSKKKCQTFFQGDPSRQVEALRELTGYPLPSFNVDSRIERCVRRSHPTLTEGRRGAKKRKVKTSSGLGFSSMYGPWVGRLGSK